jgi:glycosyltransferase involved in cell wall biosynthesis
MRDTASPENPLVTVLIPVFNGERFLAEAIDSVRSQTYANLEILVVDDGSSDATPDILRALASGDCRIVVLRKANGGIAAALNAGIAAARGDYLARMDADDVMLPGRIERQVAFLEANSDLGFCASSIEKIDMAGQTLGEYISPITSHAALRHLLARQTYFSFTHPTVMFRKAHLDTLGGYSTAFEPCEDLDLFLRFQAAGHPGLALADKLLKYRLHAKSVSATNALRQVQMRNFLFYRFYGGETERGLTFERYIAQLSFLKRLRNRADALNAIATYDVYAGRRLKGATLKALAVAMKVLCVLDRSGKRF